MAHDLIKKKKEHMLIKKNSGGASLLPLDQGNLLWSQKKCYLSEDFERGRKALSLFPQTQAPLDLAAEQYRANIL